MTSPEVLSKEFSISFLKEKLKSGGFLLLDIDGTVKGPKTLEAPWGFDPKLPVALEIFQQGGVRVGACTSQSPQELGAFVQKMEVVSEGPLFTGVSILEDGHIVVLPGQNMLTEYQILASDEALREIDSIKKVLKVLWRPALDYDLVSDGWGFFPDVPTPVAIPESKYQGVVTMSVWERGPDIYDPSYQGEYEPVMAFVAGIASALSLTRVDLVEAGNGTLRIIQKGLSKVATLSFLAERGVIDLSKTIYAGDSLNDIEPASLVKKSGGGVIAVANAIHQLKQISTYVCSRRFSHGLVEVFNKVLNP